MTGNQDPRGSNQVTSSREDGTATLYVVVSYMPATSRVVGSWADVERACDEADKVPGAYVYQATDGAIRIVYRSDDDD